MKARLLWIVVGLALAALVFARVRQAKKGAKAADVKAPDAALVRTVKVERRDLAEKVSFTGSVAAENEVDVFPKLGGRVDRLFVEVGDRVRAGQLLATVEHKELSWQARAAEAQVAAAKAQVEVAEAGLAGAQLEYDRTSALAKGGSAAAAQVDGARVRLQLAKAQVAAAKAQAAGAEAQSGLMQQQLDNTRVESPIDGVVTRRVASVGAMIGTQAAAFTVEDTARLKLDSTVDAVQFSRLARGRPAVVTVDAFPGLTFDGKVDVLSPSLDPQTRRAEVTIAIDNAAGKLLPNEFANASVTVGSLAGALVVPKDAILEAPGGEVVFRVKAGRVEELRPRLGASDGALVAVESGLSEGDELAVTGLGNLSDGAKVKVAPAVSENERR